MNCWVIEHTDAKGNTVSYFSADPVLRWSVDPFSAIRFCRQQDAEGAMFRLGLDNHPKYRACEHLFDEHGRIVQ